MKRATGIGGVFFNAKDPAGLHARHKRHLGIDVQVWGGAAFKYRVADLHRLLAVLRSEGCNALDKTDDSEYGKFGWVLDPEGKVERWQPPAGQ